MILNFAMLSLVLLLESRNIRGVQVQTIGREAEVTAVAVVTAEVAVTAYLREEIHAVLILDLLQGLPQDLALVLDLHQVPDHQSVV